ncbi:MAG: glycosyltransferase family 2 protein [Burkholderiales bacterium]|jgi:glycosyltransferase involved in cell wall biosynthesis|nr:glycosyltransferase family 2 protein [Burkholderiales bacterium]
MSEPSVAILLCTYNGEAFLREQLRSVKEQTWTNWRLWVSDDGSQDNTLRLLQDAKQEWNEHVEILYGPKKGYATNFLALTNYHEIEADYYAFCDQDDIWFADKLENALKALENMPEETPALYCSRTELINEDGAKIGLSPNFTKKPSFANALVQSIGGGNTMVFNGATRRLLRYAGADIDVPSHDWWTYLLVSGCDGVVVFDTKPSVQYRQHRNNQMGSNNSITAQLTRMNRLFSGDFRDWNKRNLKALNQVHNLLTAENQQTLNDFAKISDAPSFFLRLICFLRSGVYRQTLLGNLGILAAALSGKL